LLHFSTCVNVSKYFTFMVGCDHTSVPQARLPSYHYLGTNMFYNQTQVSFIMLWGNLCHSMLEVYIYRVYLNKLIVIHAFNQIISYGDILRVNVSEALFTGKKSKKY